MSKLGDIIKFGHSYLYVQGYFSIGELGIYLETSYGHIAPTNANLVTDIFRIEDEV